MTQLCQCTTAKLKCLCMHLIGRKHCTFHSNSRHCLGQDVLQSLGEVTERLIRAFKSGVQEPFNIVSTAQIRV